jgi:hypothetical protein
VAKERANLLAHGVYDEQAVREASEVRVVEPDARFGEIRLKLMQKSQEADVLDERKYKSRACFDGSWITDVHGKQCTDMLEGEKFDEKPLSMAGLRVFVAQAAVRGHVVLQGDVTSAYLTADLQGPPIFAKLGRGLMPEHWAKAYSEPVVKVSRALYGLPRSGFDWMAKCKKDLGSLGYVQAESEQGVFTRSRDGAAVGVYVDDMLISASPSTMSAVKKELEAVFPILFEDPSKYLGIDISYKQDTIQYEKYTQILTKVVWSQKGYSEHTCKTYVDAMQQLDKDTPFRLKTAKTPMQKDLVEKEDDGEKGVSPHRETLGALQYLSRGSRPDIAYAVNKLARSTVSWTRLHDRQLKRVIEYVNSTTDETLEWQIYAGVDSAKTLRTYTDSDFANDPSSAHSTTGWITVLVDEQGTWAVLDWGSKKQSSVSKSTAEAEITAVVDGASKSAVPISMTFEDLGVRTQLETLVDNDAARLILTQDTHTRLIAMRKTHKINLGWIRQMLRNVGMVLKRVDSEENLSDIGTKPLPREVFEYLARIILHGR